MATVKLTIRVRDLDNRVRVQESQEVSAQNIETAAQQLAARIQRAFTKVNSGVRSDK